jgi:hypothetical protein
MGLHKNIYGLRVCDIEDNTYTIKMELGPYLEKPYGNLLLKETLWEFNLTDKPKGIRTYFIYVKYDDEKLVHKNWYIWTPVDYDELVFFLCEKPG